MELFQKLKPFKNPDPIALDAKLLLKIVGILAFALPVVMLLGAWRVPEICMRESISGFYFTPLTGDLFVGILVFIGFFLFTYRGWEGDRFDNQLASFAGLCSIGVAIFPTLGIECTEEFARMRAFLPTGASANPSHYLLFGTEGSWLSSQYLHLALAGIFFLVIAYMVYFRFTITGNKATMTTHKKWRNKLYRACGILILLCVIGAGLQDKIDWPIGNYQTFKFELVALWAFGIAWMVKGELFWFLNDGE